jgi:oxygen-independent coproporphyrinogen-3 oxidase
MEEINNLPDEWYLPNADSIYFGGGTPSLLSPVDVELLISSIRSRFSISGDAEVTLEMNPEDFSSEKIRGYMDCGINRIVFGVQSLDPLLRKNLGRRGKTEIKKKLDEFFHEPGFVKCIDLITGIPGQSEDDCLDDLKIITGYRPEHISLYLLSLESGTPLSRRLIPDEFFEEMQLRVWKRSIDFLAGEGYRQYEISNYSMPGFESIHNSKYWHFVPYAGFGAGAHSFTGTRRYSNNMTVMEYIQEKNVVYSFDDRSETDVIVEFFMTALRDLRGFTREDFRRVTGVEFPVEIIGRLENLINKGFIVFANGYYSLSREGLFYANSVIYELTEDFIS